LNVSTKDLLEALDGRRRLEWVEWFRKRGKRKMADDAVGGGAMGKNLLAQQFELAMAEAEAERLEKLRDDFAGQAMAALIGLQSDCGPSGVAHDAFLYADAMLKARAS
jgi:hypothetical protein